MKTTPGNYHVSGETALLFGRGGFLFGCPFFNDTIVFDCTLGASTNLFTSWIISHRREIMRKSEQDGKDSL
jgi:hypothetical protein